MGIVWVPLTIFGGPMSLGVPGKSPLTGYISMQGANKISWSVNLTTSFCMKTSQISFFHLLSNHWWLLHKILQNPHLTWAYKQITTCHLPSQKAETQLEKLEKLSRWELFRFPPFFLMFRKPREVGQKKQENTTHQGEPVWTSMPGARSCDLTQRNGQPQKVAFWFREMTSPAISGKSRWRWNIVNHLARWIQFLGGGNSNTFGIFYPDVWGKCFPFWHHIFQMGWFNHHLEKV